MGRIVIGIIVAFVLGYALIVLFESNPARLAAVPFAAAPVPLATTTAPVEDFNETGTLVFYPNNVGPVPYLFYHARNGTLLAKALSFTELPPTDFSLWSAGRVSVNGRLVGEHVDVSRITYLAPP